MVVSRSKRAGCLFPLGKYSTRGYSAPAREPPTTRVGGRLKEIRKTLNLTLAQVGGPGERRVELSPDLLAGADPWALRVTGQYASKVPVRVVAGNDGCNEYVAKYGPKSP
jgi:hypothetical protein